MSDQERCAKCGLMRRSVIHAIDSENREIANSAHEFIVRFDQPLTISVEGDELVIRIGVGTLAFSFESGEENQPFDVELNDFRRAYKVTNRREFAKGVALGLQEEREDGSTPLTDILDRAFIHAVEYDMGIEEDGRPVSMVDPE